jgi:hypothetical protein
MQRDSMIRVGLLVALVLLSACSSRATQAPKATVAGPDSTAHLTDTTVPTVSAEGGEVAMGFTEDGLPYRGNPNAPVTMVEHSEFQ